MAKKTKWLVLGGGEKAGDIAVVVKADCQGHAIDAAAAALGCKYMRTVDHEFIAPKGWKMKDLHADLEGNLGSPRHCYQLTLVTPLEMNKNLI